MSGALVILVAGAFVLANGILMLLRPALLFELYNRVNEKVVSGDLWFRYNADAVRQGEGRWAFRTAGVPITCFGLFMISEALKALGRLVFGVGERQKAYVTPPQPDGTETVLWPVYVIGITYAIGAITLGLILVVSPKRGARILGEGRYYTSTIPSWVWRIIGAFFCVIGAVTLAQSLGWRMH